jgi:Zn-dependent peptidase ImmA (M78 family)/transcriptional regulator with XRE-family HTH domain
MTTKLPINPKLLLWACRRSGIERTNLAKRFKQIETWLSGEASPTFKQLEDFAKATHTPFGYFFLPAPPEEPLPLPDFRTTTKTKERTASPELLNTIYAMQQRQAWLKDFLIEEGSEPLGFVGSARLSDDAEGVAHEMRRLVGLENNLMAQVQTWQGAVSALRRAIENMGVMAVINGVVGNDTHRQLSVDEFRGFALSDPYAPLIFVNGRDAKSAQMFTLAHELAHIWLGKEGISGFESLFPGGEDVEEWCNKAAAEFLIPAKELRLRWNDLKRTKVRFEVLARHFKVSPIVAGRRAVDLKLISRDEFFDFYNEYTERDFLRKPEKGGGDFYNTQNTRVGEFFVMRVYNAAMEGRIGFQTAYDLTGLKDGTFQRYVKQVTGEQS